VSLWICNDETLYRFALDCIAKACDDNKLDHATHLFMITYGKDKTPDGAIYNALSVKLCLQSLMGS
jgi:hypothetical protein